MPRKKTTNAYFDDSVEQSIHQYNLSNNERERNEFFKTIYPALCKLAQVWRNKIKPTYVELPAEELEADCVTFLLEKLPMIKSGKGKAFSYSLETMPDTFDVEEVPSKRPEEMESNSLLFDTFIEFVEENFEEMFSAKVQKDFARCFLEKIKSYGLSENFNRRKMLNDISKETGIGRGLVTKHVNRVAAFYSTFKDYFETYGIKPDFSERVIITDEDKEYIHKHYQHYSKRNGLSGISRRLGIRYDVIRDYIKSTL